MCRIYGDRRSNLAEHLQRQTDRQTDREAGRQAAAAMAEDNQHLKKAAALAYDYERDERWSEYWSNVLIPENRSKSDVERYFKFKFYQRNIVGFLFLSLLSHRLCLGMFSLFLFCVNRIWFL